MRYYNYDMQRELPQNMRDSLQKYFPTNDFGVSLVLDNLAGDVDLVSIDRCEGSVTGKSTWTHYANLQRTDEGTWELNEPWEKVCSCTLHIHYNGHPNRYGYHWSLSGFSDEMDKIMLDELGDSYKSYATLKDMMIDLEKIVARKIPVHYKYVNGKHVPIKYELA